MREEKAMRKIFALLLPTLLVSLAACTSEQGEDRASQVQERCAGSERYTAVAEVTIVQAEENGTYTLRVDAAEETAKVTVLAPDALAGVTAELSADTRRLEYDGLVLDAGNEAGGLCAANCVPRTLRAAAEGYLLEQNTEPLGGVDDALRLTFESEMGGAVLHYTIWFDENDVPLYAEIAEEGKIAAFIYKVPSGMRMASASGLSK